MSLTSIFDELSATLAVEVPDGQSREQLSTDTVDQPIVVSHSWSRPGRSSADSPAE